MRCFATACAAVIALYLMFLGGMSLITPVVLRALTRKEK